MLGTLEEDHEYISERTTFSLVRGLFDKTKNKVTRTNVESRQYHYPKNKSLTNKNVCFYLYTTMIFFPLM